MCGGCITGMCLGFFMVFYDLTIVLTSFVLVVFSPTLSPSFPFLLLYSLIRLEIKFTPLLISVIDHNYHTHFTFSISFTVSESLLTNLSLCKFFVS